MLRPGPCVLDETRAAVLLRVWPGSRGEREKEREEPGSDGHSLVLRARTDGDTACGHSHLAVKVPRTKAEPDSSQSEISDAGLTFDHMKLTHVYQ